MNRSLKALLTLGVSLTSLLMAPVAHAATSPNNNWYAGASGDLTWLRHSDTGGGGNVDLGYRFDNWRLEGEAGYHGAPGSGGFDSTHYFTYMANAYYDFNTVFPTSSSGWHVSPYVGGGVGDAAIHYGAGGFSSTFSHHENDFAYQGMAGLTLASASVPGTDWSLGYRYLGTDDTSPHASSVELGVRFNF